MQDPKSDKSARSPWARAKKKSLTACNANSRVAIPDAVDFIVDQLNLPRGVRRDETEKVRKRIKRAVDQQRIPTAAKGTVLFGELITWGLRIPEWSSVLSSFPSRKSGRANLALPPLTVAAGGRAISSDPAEKERQLRDAMLRNHALETTVMALNAELERLRPLEIKDKQRRVASSDAGKKGGRPRNS